jgi:hypothetical protein
VALSIAATLAASALAAGTSVTLKLKGQYAKRTASGCHNRAAYRLFHRSSSILYKGFQTPHPAGHFPVVLEANRAYEHFRATGRDKRGRRLSSHPPKPYQPPAQPAGYINTTDPDSRVMNTVGQPGKQGYNAQAAVNENQIVIAAEIADSSPDFGNLELMVAATERELHAAGVDQLPGVVVADPGYWHTEQMEGIVSRGMEVLVPPESRLRTTAVTARSWTVSWRPTSHRRSTRSAKQRSSRCSGRSSTTAGLTASNDEAAPPSAPNRGSQQPRTTC